VDLPGVLAGKTQGQEYCPTTCLFAEGKSPICKQVVGLRDSPLRAKRAGALRRKAFD
jgi:hypothetical protein